MYRSKHCSTASRILLASYVTLAALLCATSASPATSAQTPAAPSAQGSTKTPAATPAPSPSSSADGSTVPSTTSPDSAASDPSAAAKKPKKVWTNEEVTGISSTISVVGDGRNGKSKNAPQTPADPAYVASVRKKLQDLQDKMAAADKELASLKDFSEGEPVATADREFHKSYNNQPIGQQITNLQAKKIDLQSKIDALLDEARKKGVEPGQLR